LLSTVKEEAVMERRKGKKKSNLFFERMKDLGYEDVTDFARRSKISLSFETCRRAIHDDRQNISFQYVVVLMQALDFTTQEIGEELKRRGDKHLYKLISDSGKGVLLNSQEKLIIDRLREQADLVPIVTTIVTLREKKGKKEKEEG
jgi:hypothetical protein